MTKALIDLSLDQLVDASQNVIFSNCIFVERAFASSFRVTNLLGSAMKRQTAYLSATGTRWKVERAEKIQREFRVLAKHNIVDFNCKLAGGRLLGF